MYVFEDLSVVGFIKTSYIYLVSDSINHWMEVMVKIKKLINNLPLT